MSASTTANMPMPMPSVVSEPAPTMSFPALLRNPGLASRYAHLLPGAERQSARAKKSDGTVAPRDKEGKRRIRRRENAKFTSNPHIVAPSAKDYSLLPNERKRTFPEPVPAFLAVNKAPPPTGEESTYDPASAKAGQFTLSLRGLRKELRRSGPGTEGLVRDVEAALLTWLETGDVTVFAASGIVRDVDAAPATPSFSEEGPIREVDRSAARLVWSIRENSFARFVVHCVCRWHSAVSYSKLDGPVGSQTRLTYILRPNPSRAAPTSLNAQGGPLGTFDTPPTTVLDSASSRGGTLESQESGTDDTGAEWDIVSSDPDVDHGSDAETSSLIDSIPDMRDSRTLPLITQHALAQSHSRGPGHFLPQTPQRPSPLSGSSTTPTALAAFQALNLDEADVEDDTDHDALDITPRALRDRPRRTTRNMTRAALRSARSRSRSSPSNSRSPSAVRWGQAGQGEGVPLAARAPAPSAMRTGASPRDQSLWAYVYS